MTLDTLTIDLRRFSPPVPPPKPKVRREDIHIGSQAFHCIVVEDFPENVCVMVDRYSPMVTTPRESFLKIIVDVFRVLWYLFIHDNNYQANLPSR